MSAALVSSKLSEEEPSATIVESATVAGSEEFRPASWRDFLWPKGEESLISVYGPHRALDASAVLVVLAASLCAVSVLFTWYETDSFLVASSVLAAVCAVGAVLHCLATLYLPERTRLREWGLLILFASVTGPIVWISSVANHDRRDRPAFSLFILLLMLPPSLAIVRTPVFVVVSLVAIAVAFAIGDSVLAVYISCAAVCSTVVGYTSWGAAQLTLAIERNAALSVKAMHNVSQQIGNILGKVTTQSVTKHVLLRRATLHFVEPPGTMSLFLMLPVRDLTCWTQFGIALKALYETMPDTLNSTARCIGDLMFAALTGTELAKDVRMFVRQALRLAEVWGNLGLRNSFTMVIHRGFGAIAMIGSSGVSLEPVGPCVEEGLHCIRHCMAGTVCATSAIAQCCRTANFPVVFDRIGSISVEGPNPIPIDLFGLRTTANGATAAAAAALPLEAAHGSTTTPKSVKREVRIVTNEEQVAQAMQHTGDSQPLSSWCWKTLLELSRIVLSNSSGKRSLRFAMLKRHKLPLNNALLPVTDDGTACDTYFRPLSLWYVSPFANPTVEDEFRSWSAFVLPGLGTGAFGLAVFASLCNVVGYSIANFQHFPPLVLSCAALLCDMMSFTMVLRAQKGLSKAVFASKRTFTLVSCLPFALGAVAIVLSLCAPILAWQEKSNIVVPFSSYAACRMIIFAHSLRRGKWLRSAVIMGLFFVAPAVVIVNCFPTMYRSTSDQVLAGLMIVLAWLAPALLCAADERARRIAYLNWKTCERANKDVSHARYLERSALDQFLGPFFSREVLRRGLRQGQSFQMPGCLVLWLQMPSFQSIDREELAPLDELHRLRSVADTIALSYGFVPAPGWTGDHIAYIEYFAELLSPQAEARRSVVFGPNVVGQRGLSVVVRTKVHLAAELWATVLQHFNGAVEQGIHFGANTANLPRQRSTQDGPDLPLGGSSTVFDASLRQQRSSSTCMLNKSGSNHSSGGSKLHLGPAKVLRCAVAFGALTIGVHGSGSTVSVLTRGPTLTEAQRLVDSSPVIPISSSKVVATLSMAADLAIGSFGVASGVVAIPTLPRGLTELWATRPSQQTPRFVATDLSEHVFCRWQNELEGAEGATLWFGSV